MENFWRTIIPRKREELRLNVSSDVIKYVYFYFYFSLGLSALQVLTAGGNPLTYGAFD